jgi:AraC family transcriptional activator of pyochelin receptor
MAQRIARADVRQRPLGGSGWVRQQLPPAVGECYADRFELEPGLAVVRSRYGPVDDLVEENASADGASTLVVTLGIAGDSGYVGRDGTCIGFRAGHTAVSSFRNNVGERRYQAGAMVSQLRLLVSEPLLVRYLGEPGRALMPEAGVRQLAWRGTSPAAAAHAAALARSAGDPPQEALDLHIHALSLLAEQLRGLTLPPPLAQAPQRLRQADAEKIERVRDLMAAQMDRALTVGYLCTAVGLSESKLKQGLRQRFDTSPHRMLLEMRMQRAWTLLASGSQVAQAAWQVGYAHPSNFSAAFTRFFGRTPKSVFGPRSGAGREGTPEA